jgi:hypothetical protein
MVSRSRLVPTLFLLPLLAVAMLPADSSAQIQSLPTAPPRLSATDRDWFQDRAPIEFAGDLYYPAGARVHFDPDVMVQTGSYDGVPLYSDTSVTPYSEVLVPAGDGQLQPYERRRAGYLAGTTGSHTPDFPVEIVPWEDSRDLGATDVGQGWQDRHQPKSAGRRRAVPAPPEAPVREDLLQQPGRIWTVVAPENNRGIWITYEGVRWASTGRAEPFDVARFSRIGDYFGFPVFSSRGTEEIFIPAVKGGMLAVYRKDKSRP